MDSRVIGLLAEPRTVAAAVRGGRGLSYGRATSERARLLDEIAEAKNRIARARVELEMAQDPEFRCVCQAQQVLQDEMRKHHAEVAAVVAEADARVDRILAPFRGGESGGDLAQPGRRLVPFLPSFDRVMPPAESESETRGDAGELISLRCELGDLVAKAETLERHVAEAPPAGGDMNSLILLERIFTQTIETARATHVAALERAKVEAARQVAAALARAERLTVAVPRPRGMVVDDAAEHWLIQASPTPAPRPAPPATQSPEPAPVAPAWSLAVVSPPEESWPPPVAWPPKTPQSAPAAEVGPVATDIAWTSNGTVAQGQDEYRPSTLVPVGRESHWAGDVPDHDDEPGPESFPSAEARSVPSRSGVRTPGVVFEPGRPAHFAKAPDARHGPFLLDVVLPLIAVAIVLLVVLSWIG